MNTTKMFIIVSNLPVIPESIITARTSLCWERHSSSTKSDKEDTMKILSDNIVKNTEDEWDWKGPLVAVQGFGFLPQKVNAELDQMTQVPDINQNLMF